MCHQFGQPEFQEFDLAGFGQENISRLDIPMNDVLFTSRDQGTSDLDRQFR
jgi:hypothetical protein